ncbi:MAG: dTMP kinase [Halieaceae bacterium]|nr:dTMP kinase [Halieaceae bacterium]
MAETGLFITLEGGEGVGKTTGMEYLEHCLREQGVDLVVTREPGGTRFGERVRDLLLEVRQESMDDMAELLLIFAARAQHLREVIKPALGSGKWVLCDRFTDATYAYQCGGRGIDPAVVSRLETLVQGALRPNFTILFDAPVSVGMARAKDRGELDRFERESSKFFAAVRQNYLARAAQDAERVRVIDASQPLDAVKKSLKAVVMQIIEAAPSRGTL